MSAVLGFGRFSGHLAWLLLAGSLVACGGSSDSGGGAAARPSMMVGALSDQYTPLSRWICHPDLPDSDDACATGMETLSVAASGEATVLPFERATDPGFDCFYAYPTASLDPGQNSDLFPGPQERQVTQVQFARYGEHCRTFAPVYRQRTLTSLAAAVAAGTLIDLQGSAEALELAYSDVREAFRHYLADQNNGRGVLLVGHSQGASLLRRLIAEEIENDPVLRDRLIGAHLLGTSVAVPIGEDVGGSFARTPACRSASQTGCVISYASYRAGDPQLDAPLFGTTVSPLTEALCVNPAALAGGSSALDVRFPRRQPPAFETLLIPRGSGGPYQDITANLLLTDPYFTVPGQISGQCVRDANGTHYLEVTVAPEPDGPRANDYPGEFLGGIGWGLHLIDVSLTQGNLVRVAGQQGEAWENTR
jgi:hypothetical protein